MKTALHTSISPKLSTAGRVAAYMAIAMCATQANAQITASGDTNTQVTNQAGVDVVNIAAPSAQGLSHNKYNDYSVSQNGAVLNNSPNAGNSALAGRLSANTNLNNGTASVILNEVVSTNESLLLGKQEVFGMAADYVLANPNGITCDGCGFINTPRASLVVGQPIVDKDVLAHFLLDNDKKLHVKNEVSANSIDFLAPTVDIDADIKATNDINVILGRSKVTYPDLQTSPISGSTSNPLLSFGNCCNKDKDKKPKRDKVLDGRVVGSMQAGRIRIHSIDNRVNLYTNAQGNAAQNITIDMAAKTQVQDSQLAAKDININSKDLLINGKKETKVISSDSKTSQEGSWFNKVDVLQTKKQEKETYSKTTLNADNVQITAKKDAKVIATDITADNATLKATAVNAEADTIATDIQYELNKKSKGLWHNQTENKSIDNTLVQNNWQITNKLTVDATDTTLHAVKVKAKEVSLKGTNSLNVNAGKVTDSSTSTNDYKNETAKLKTGKHVVRDDNTQTVSTNINAQKITLTSHGKAEVTNSKLTAKNIEANGRGSLAVTTDKAETLKSDTESYKYWGGIGGGYTKGTSKTTSTHKGSNLTADNISLNNESGVSITGSQISATQNLNIKANSGDISINHVKNNITELSNERKGTAFNITKRSEKTQNSADTTVSSQLNATNVSITAKNIAVNASDLSATDALNINAYETFKTNIADAQTTQAKETYQLGFKGYTKTDGSKLEGKAGLRLQGVTTLKGTGTGVGTANTLNAKNVSINAKDTNLKGTLLTSEALNVTADKLTVGAGEVKTASEFDNKGVTGAGIYVSGSLTKIALGAEIGHEQTNKSKDTFKAQQSAISLTNDVTLDVNDMTFTGAKVTTPNAIALKSKNLTTQAAHDRIVETEVNGKGGVTLEAYAKLSPAVGGNLSLDGEGNKKVTTTKKAVVTTLEGSNANIVTAEKYTDIGTNYSIANAVNITAKEYQGKAAQDTKVAIDHAGKVGTDLDVYTSDFASVTFEVGANGEYQYDEQGESKAVKGKIVAKNIKVTAQDKLAISHNLEADNVNLSAKDSVAITQDNNSQWKLQGGFSAGGSVGVTYVPPNAAKPEASINGSVNYLKVNDSQAVISNINAKDVTLNADNTVGVAGANITTNNLNMTADNVVYDAAYDSHKATGVDLSGQLSVKLAFKQSTKGTGCCKTTTTKVSSAGAGIGADIGIINEASTTAHGGKITAKNITMTANSNQALNVVGADINTDTLNIKNSAGDVNIVAGKSTIFKGNGGIGAHAGAEAGKKKVKKIGVGAHLDIDTESSVYYDQGSITAKNVNVAADKNTHLQTNLTANTLNVATGNDLTVSSARDKTGKFLFKVGTNVGYKKIFDGKKLDAEKVVSSINSGMIFGVKASGNLNVNIDHRKETQVAAVQVNDMVLNVGSGNMSINAAKVTAQNTTGIPAKVVKTDNKDFVHNIGFDFDAKTPNPLAIVKSLIKGEKVESPIKADGRFKWEDYTSTAELKAQ